MKAKRESRPQTFLDLTSDYDRYAEMDKIEKNKISHRFLALEKLKAWLQEA